MADVALMETIGKNVRKYREKAHLTQAELAELVGVENAFISRVERGQKLMKLKTLLALADALHVSADLLLYQESRNAQIQTLTLMLEGQSPEFVDGIIELVRTCIENLIQSKIKYKICVRMKKA